MADKTPVKFEELPIHFSNLVGVGLADKYDFTETTQDEGVLHFKNVLEGIYDKMDELVNGQPERVSAYDPAIDVYNRLVDYGLTNGSGEGAPAEETPADEQGEPEETPTDAPAEEQGEPEETPTDAPAEETPPEEPKAAATAKPKGTPKAAKPKGTPKVAAKPKEKPAKEPTPPPEPNVLHIQGFERFGLTTITDLENHKNPKWGEDGLFVIDPQMAADWLDKFNLRNRQIYKSAVKKMGADACGNQGRAWTYNGGRVAFYKDWDDPKGEDGFPITIRSRDPETGTIKSKVKMTKNQIALADGQHRLMMAVMFQIPLVTEVVFGMPWVSENYLDSQQKTRTMKDAIHKDGHANPGLLSQTAAFLLRYDRRTGHGLPTSPWPNITQGQEYIHKNTKLETVVGQVMESVFARKHSPKFWAAALFLVRKKNAKLADEIASKIVDFAELKKGDPLLVLQNKLTSLEGQKRGGVAAMDEYGALIFKAFKAKLDGKTLDKLAFGAKDDYPEF